MERDGFVEPPFRLIDCSTGSHAARKIRHVGGIVSHGLLDNYCVTLHLPLTVSGPLV
jgi:hypothetical protein